jgi:hypothetical protein
MNRTRIVVTVCHPEGHYQMVELPADHRMIVDGMGEVTVRQVPETVGDRSDLPIHLRLLAHPFTGVTMSAQERDVIIAAADMIEELEARRG